MNMFNIQKELNEYTYSKNKTEEEIIRTNLIATYQNNIPNPFILDSTLINRCYFNTYNIGDIKWECQVTLMDGRMVYLLKECHY